MKKILFTLLFLFTSLSAGLKHEYLNQKLLDSGVPIVDIRTVGEWHETGILNGSIPIEFFTEQGEYDIAAFVKELNEKVDTKKPFALICRTGSRTKMIAPFFADKFGYDIINVAGGIMIHRMNPADLDFVKYK